MTFKFYRSKIICDFIELLFSVENMSQIFQFRKVSLCYHGRNLDFQGVSEIDNNS